MPLPQHTGTYIAVARQWSVEAEPGKCPRWIVDFTLLQYRDAQGWGAVDGEASITGRFTIINKDGQPNEINCKMIVDSYKLADFSFAVLTTHPFDQTEVQLVIDHREYTDSSGNPKSTMDVKYLNPRDYEGRKLQSDPSAVQSLESKYGALLRAKFATKPTAPSTRPATRAPAKTNTIDGAKKAAWEAFKAVTTSMTTTERNEAWSATVEKYSGGKAPAEITPKGWGDIHALIASDGAVMPQEVGADAGEDGPPVDPKDIPF